MAIMVDVPNRPAEGRRNRSFRIDDEAWELLGEVADSIGWDRGQIIRDLVSWYLADPAKRHAEIRRVPKLPQ